MTINLLLFDRFETLDAFGPVEMLSDMGNNTIMCCSLAGGPIRSSHGFAVDTVPLVGTDETAVLLIPGGMGTRGYTTAGLMLICMAVLFYIVTNQHTTKQFHTNRFVKK